jgi:GT2 family glycosyltransferase
MQKIAIAILNWNGKHHLQKFLPDVVKYSNGTEIYVIDNGSTDDSISLLQRNFPQVKIILNDKNYGFAQGYNEGLKQIDAAIYILLNSDVQVTENWINPVVELFQKDDKIAVIQPKVKSFNQPEYFEHAGAAGGFIDKDFFPFCRGRIFDMNEKDMGQYDEQTEIFWATGACFFIRSQIYHDNNGFDGNFFAHMEEIDLCWRLKNRGYKIFYTPQSTIYHLGGGTLDYLSPRKTFLNFRNNLFLILKNYRGNFLFFKLFRRLMLDGIAGLKFLFSMQFKHTWAVLKAHFAFYSGLFYYLNKRKKLKLNDCRPNKTGIYNKSIVYDFYINRIKKFSELSEQDFTK